MAAEELALSLFSFLSHMVWQTVAWIHAEQSEIVFKGRWLMWLWWSIKILEVPRGILPPVLEEILPSVLVAVAAIQPSLLANGRFVTRFCWPRVRLAINFCSLFCQFVLSFYCLCRCRCCKMISLHMLRSTCMPHLGRDITPATCARLFTWALSFFPKLAYGFGSLKAPLLPDKPRSSFAG